MNLLARSSLDFIQHFLGEYPGRSALMVVLLAISGLGEGIGVVTLLPLLQLASSTGAEAEPSSVTRIVEAVLGTVGLAPTLGVLLTLIVASIGFKSFTMWLAMREVGFTMARVVKDLRLDLVRALLDARWSYFGRRSVGEFANAISREAVRAAAAYKEACQALGAVIQIVVYLAIAFVLAWHVSLAAIVVGALFLGALRALVGMSRSAGQDQTDLTRSLSGRLVDALRGIKPVKAMGREHLFWPLLEREVEGLNRAHRRRVLASETLILAQEPLVTLALAGGLYAALAFTTIPFSELIVLAFIFYRLMRHINTLQMRYQIMSEGESAFWSLRRAVEEARAYRETFEGTWKPGRMVEGIRFASVGFGYEDHERLLAGLDITIPAGSFVALTGVSGVGKTTIVDLIAGLQRPTSGEILLDAVPMSEIDVPAWRRSIGYVPQETPLFNDSILQNVTLGDPDRSREEVEHALRAAGAWEFVAERAGGMDEVVGEAGSQLSGGQRQRIAIARALLGEPDLLILDEVTTALDPETEAAICDTLRDLKGTLTIVAISHQPAIQDAADIIYEVTRDGVRVGSPLAAGSSATPP